MNKILLRFFIIQQLISLYLNYAFASSNRRIQLENLKELRSPEIQLTLKVTIIMFLISPAIFIFFNYLSLRNKATSIKRNFVLLLFGIFALVFPVSLVLKICDFWSMKIYILRHDLEEVTKYLQYESPLFLIALVVMVLCEKGLPKEQKTICWLFVISISANPIFSFLWFAYLQIKQGVNI